MAELVDIDAVSSAEEAEVGVDVLDRIARLAAQQREQEELLDRLIGQAKTRHSWEAIGVAMGMTGAGVRFRMRRRGWLAVPTERRGHRGGRRVRIVGPEGAP